MIRISCNNLFVLSSINAQHSQIIILTLPTTIWSPENHVNLFFLSLLVCIFGVYSKRNVTIKLLCFRLLRIVLLHVVKPPTAYLVGVICFILLSIFKARLFWTLILFKKTCKIFYMIQKWNLRHRRIQNLDTILEPSLYCPPPLTGKFLILILWFILLVLDKCYPLYTLFSALRCFFFVCFWFSGMFWRWLHSSIEKYFSFLFIATLYSTVRLYYNYDFLMVDIWVVPKLYHIS